MELKLSVDKEIIVFLGIIFILFCSFCDVSVPKIWPFVFSILKNILFFSPLFLWGV